MSIGGYVSKEVKGNKWGKLRLLQAEKEIPESI